ncbi:hypothetical protein O6H91_03G064500 [Diphasiastrum complanatum]|uniref:Uncharacterized protein n=1 Tax=Diphasiastrum complanatum TaxID=34168 RepID=A0ACC2E7F5_DIPCM|nr:hypothetical protein O6H91_03G064500 [Diphasiastrum complanatum]
MTENVEKVVELSEAQQAAVKAPINRPLLIVAAAGSGKTLVLCHRILHLISQGLSPKEILAVTFTRRAGQDLLSRVRTVAAAVIPDIDKSNTCMEGIRIGTFHSFCLSLLRAFPSHAGLAPNFVIFTPKMQMELLEALVKEWYTEINDNKKLSFALPADDFPQNSTVVQGKFEPSAVHKGMFKAEAYRVLRKIRYLENCTSTGELGLSLESNQMKQIDEELFKYVYSNYQLSLQRVNAIDFNSFIRCTIRLLKRCPQALPFVGMQFQHILVDEFQDTDTSQFELLQLLCVQHQHLTIVGDDDQQIYSWRGANGFQNLFSFPRLFPDAEVVKLEQNFRSTGAIVAAARCVIAKNVKRMPKTIRTSSPTGQKLTVCECRNELCEALAVADFISSMRAQGVPLRQIAIIYRLHRVGLEVQHNLQARGIDCEIKGSGSGIGEDGINFPDANRGAMYDILAVLRLVVNEADDFACKSLFELLCVAPTNNISACIQHLQRAKGISLLHALKLVRSHFLGVSMCEHLCFYDSISKTDVEAFDGIRKLLSLVSNTMRDSQTLPMRDVIYNLLQQIAAYRDRADFETEEMSKGAETSATEGTPSYSQKGHGPGRIYFGGIKCLLKEASHFDSEQRKLEEKSSVMPTFRVQDVRQNSYKDMKAHLRGRELRSQPCLAVTSSNSIHKPQKLAVEKLGEFLNRIAMKLHDNELGESHLELPSGRDAVTARDIVTLSTVHQAKGLEWTCIIFVRANEGILPVINDEIISEDKSPRTACEGATDLLPQHLVELLNYAKGCPVYTTSKTLPSCKKEALLFSSGIPQTEGIEEEITHLMAAGGQQLIPSRFLADIPYGLIKRTVCYESSNFETTTPKFKLLQDETGGFSPAFGTPKQMTFSGQSNLNTCDSLSDPVGLEKNKRKLWQSRSMHHVVKTPNNAFKSTNSRSARRLDSPLSETNAGSQSRKVPNSKREQTPEGCFENVVHLSDDSEFKTPAKIYRKKRRKFVVSSPSLKDNVV